MKAIAGMISPEGSRTSQHNPVSTEAQLRQQLSIFYRSGELSREEFRCLAEFTDLFNPSGNPLEDPIGREAFETSLKYMTDLDENLVKPFVEKLLQAGVLLKAQTSSGEDAVVIPSVVLEQAAALVADLVFDD